MPQSGEGSKSSEGCTYVQVSNPHECRRQQKNCQKCTHITLALAHFPNWHERKLIHYSTVRAVVPEPKKKTTCFVKDQSPHVVELFMPLCQTHGSHRNCHTIHGLNQHWGQSYIYSSFSLLSFLTIFTVETYR